MQFRNADDAKKALEQLNGFELAGRPMKVGNVTERTDLLQGSSLLDTDELDRSGIDLGATGRYVHNFELNDKLTCSIDYIQITSHTVESTLHVCTYLILITPIILFRLQLMFKLAEGTGLEIPPAAANALNMAPVIAAPQQPPQAAPPIATQCFMLSNMFDPQK